jgi:hypothetical protein
MRSFAHAEWGGNVRVNDAAADAVSSVWSSQAAINGERLDDATSEPVIRLGVEALAIVQERFRQRVRRTDRTFASGSCGV